MQWEKVTVVVRVRPLSQREQQRGDREVVVAHDGGEVSVLLPQGEGLKRQFRFSAALSPRHCQQQVYDSCGLSSLLPLTLTG
uniref:Kinesin-like protein KIF12 n=1 Tax=Petromyzon marinus TaxID=7757 RepID=A0AAJ7UKG1_PETMA